MVDKGGEQATNNFFLIQGYNNNGDYLDVARWTILCGNHTRYNKQWETLFKGRVNRNGEHENVIIEILSQRKYIFVGVWCRVELSFFFLQELVYD